MLHSKWHTRRKRDCPLPNLAPRNRRHSSPQEQQRNWRQPCQKTRLLNPDQQTILWTFHQQRRHHPLQSTRRSWFVRCFWHSWIWWSLSSVWTWWINSKTIYRWSRTSSGPLEGESRDWSCLYHEHRSLQWAFVFQRQGKYEQPLPRDYSVSYTHLTLPTICSV